MARSATSFSSSVLSSSPISPSNVSEFVASAPEESVHSPSVHYLALLKHTHAESKPPRLDAVFNPLPRKILKHTLSTPHAVRQGRELSVLVPASLMSKTPQDTSAEHGLELQSLVPTVVEMKSSNTLSIESGAHPRNKSVGTFLNEYGNEPLARAASNPLTRSSVNTPAGAVNILPKRVTTDGIGAAAVPLPIGTSILPNEARTAEVEGEYASVCVNDVNKEKTILPHHGLIRIGDGIENHERVAINFFPDNSSRTLNFRLHIFVIETIIHTFGPLSAPFMHFFLGPSSVANHVLLTFDVRKPGAFGNYLWAIWVVMNMFYFAGYTSVISLSEVFLANCLFVSRNLVIAIKYAYFAPAEYESHCMREWSPEEIKGTLLATSWSVLSRQKQNQEILLAVHRLGLDIDTEAFTFTGFLQNSQLLSDKLSDLNLDDAAIVEWKYRIKFGEVPAKLLLLELVRDATERHSVRGEHMRVIWLLALVHCLIPLLYRVGHGELPFGSSVYDVLTAIFVFIISIINFEANVYFLIMSTADFNRRSFLMEHCSALLSRMHGFRNPISSYLPLLDLTNAINCSNWLEVRQVFRGFGLQYHKRVQGYGSIWTLLMAAFVLFFIIEAFLDHSVELVSLVYALFDGTVLCVTLINMLLAARALNDQHLEHRRILVKKKALLQRTISLHEYADEKERKQLIASRDMLNMVSDVIDVEDSMNPVRILGFEASTNFFAGMLSVAFSLLAAAIRLFTRMDI